MTLFLIGFFQRVAPAVMTPELMAAFGISANGLGGLSASYYYGNGRPLFEARLADFITPLGLFGGTLKSKSNNSFAFPKRKEVDSFFLFCYYTIRTVYFRRQERDQMSPRASSREIIIDAAEAVVLENGARHMTLDSVASRAGVSKGGLLYHFPSKDALLRAMLERLRKNMEETREKKSKGLKKGPGREIKAYILSGADRDPRKDQIGSALLAAVAHDPKLLQSARDDFRRSLAEFTRSGLHFKRVAVISFAVTGLILSELLSLSPLSSKERHELVEELLRLADE